jgi:hypothetical protein
VDFCGRTAQSEGMAKKGKSVNHSVLLLGRMSAESALDACCLANLRKGMGREERRLAVSKRIRSPGAVPESRLSGSARSEVCRLPCLTTKQSP